MKLLDYECKTTFWEDFTIAEHFGGEAIRDTYKQAKREWGYDKVYGTELSMVLNHKCWFWYEKRNQKLSEFYAKLWEEYHNWVLDNWKDEELKCYLRVVD